MNVAYDFGDGAHQIHRFFQAKRPWSHIKDEIVGKYVDCYLNTVQALQKSILIVDGFAGPGRFADGSDGSPLIICKTVVAARARGKAVGMSCLFADTRAGHRTALQTHLEDYLRQGICEPAHADCAAAIERAIQLGGDSTIFFYLDPFGIKDLEFQTIRQIRQRNVRLSTEVLINFNFRTFMRHSGNWTEDDSADEIARKVKVGKVEMIDRVMGGDYWCGIVTDPKLSPLEREDAVMAAYVARVRDLFGFAFAVPVKVRETSTDPGVPSDELAKYFLVFGTRSPRAVKFMNDVASKALEPYMRQFTDGVLFDVTPERYQKAEREVVKQALVARVQPAAMTRLALIEAVIPQFFLQYRTPDYRQMVDELSREGRLFAQPQTIKRKNMLNDNALLAARSWA